MIKRKSNFYYTFRALLPEYGWLHQSDDKTTEENDDGRESLLRASPDCGFRDWGKLR